VDELLAVALASGHTALAAAKKMKVSHTLVYSRLKEPAFARRVLEIRAEMTERAIGQTAALLQLASERLLKLLKSKNEVVALGAVRTVYDAHLKMRTNVELALRMTKLEEALGLVPATPNPAAETPAAVPEEKEPE
jgi:hypothetical protein